MTQSGKAKPSVGEAGRLAAREREERRADALRENLRRRKMQARARAEVEFQLELDPARPPTKKFSTSP